MSLGSLSKVSTDQILRATNGGQPDLLRKEVASGAITVLDATLAANEAQRFKMEAQKQAQQKPTIRDQLLNPQPQQQAAPPAPPGAPPASPPPQQMASAPPPPQGGAPMHAAGGGLIDLPLPDSMFNERHFAPGGIVAFSGGGSFGNPKSRAAAKARAEQYYGKPISDAEFDMLVKATHAEASARSVPQEEAGIMGSILNRARTDDGGIQGALTKPNAFQSVTGTGANNHAPSNLYVKGPNPGRADNIYGSSLLLDQVPQDQTDFSSANPKAYGPGTDIGYMQKMKDNPGSAVLGGTVFHGGKTGLGQLIANLNPVQSAQADTYTGGDAEAVPNRKPKSAPSSSYDYSGPDPDGALGYYNISSANDGKYIKPPSLYPMQSMKDIDPNGSGSGLGDAARYVGTNAAGIAGNLFGVLPGKVIANVHNWATVPQNQIPKEDTKPSAPTGPHMPYYKMGSDPAAEAAFKAPVTTPAATPTTAPAAASSEDAISKWLADQQQERKGMALLSVAGAMMSTKRPDALGGFGEGVTAGVKEYGSSGKDNDALALKKEELANSKDYQNKMLSIEAEPEGKWEINTAAAGIMEKAKAAGIPMSLAAARAQAIIDKQSASSLFGGGSMVGALRNSIKDLQGQLLIAPDDATKKKIQAQIDQLQARFDAYGVGGSGLGGASSGSGVVSVPWT